MAAPSVKAFPAQSTQVYLYNRADQELSMYDRKYWHGAGNLPRNFKPQTTGYFQHSTYSDAENPVAAVVYVVKKGIMWLVAWKNTSDETNKVYSEITNDFHINWEKIKEKLENGCNHAEVTALGYKSTLDIKANIKPNLNAKLEEATSA
ncbi:uncharacterized protein LOC120158093 [Hibiscus syriacus]|uniref:uncharacterized protein LOC120158093 n=1 Tax=Hibiscus syriacus TaxID=106335 RepID=UPI0019204B05|nr:uncharacterized protein LOC120158093 [Hibiscus syriacus]